MLILCRNFDYRYVIFLLMLSQLFRRFFQMDPRRHRHTGTEVYFSPSYEYRVTKPEYRVTKPECRVKKTEYRVTKPEYRVIDPEYRVTKTRVSCHENERSGAGAVSGMKKVVKLFV